MTLDASRATTGAGRPTKPVRGLVIIGGGGALPRPLNLAVRHPLPLLLGLLTPPPDPLSLHLFPFVQVIGRRWLAQLLSQSRSGDERAQQKEKDKW